MEDKSDRGETLNSSEPETTEGSTDSLDPWTAKTAERAYYRQGKFFIKRTLRPSEYMTTLRGTKHIPRLNKERHQNEAAAIRHIRRVTYIPVPTLYGAFEVDDALMLITEYIDGVAMSKLSEDQKEIVLLEVQQHLTTLRGIKSDTIGGSSETGHSGIVIPPHRVMRIAEDDDWQRKVSKNHEYVFCHNDLSQHIVVDPETLKITAIIDWEYAGFYPEYFEGPFYKRACPSEELDGEHDDSVESLQFMKAT